LVDLRLVAPSLDGGRRLDPGLEAAFYRVAQEALNNCLKHALATRVTVTLLENGSNLNMIVMDDGRGYDQGQVKQSGAARSLGILGMRERLRPWEGTVAVESSVGAGTKVVACVDLDRMAAARG
jgi:signal transduction histidine kinase